METEAGKPVRSSREFCGALQGRLAEVLAVQRRNLRVDLEYAPSRARAVGPTSLGERMPVLFDTAQLAKLMAKSLETALASDVQLAIRCAMVSHASLDVVLTDALLQAHLNRSHLRAAFEWGARYGMADALESMPSDHRPEVGYAVPFALEEFRVVRELARNGSEPDDIARFRTRCQSPALTADEQSLAELILQTRRPTPSEVAKLLVRNPRRIAMLGVTAVEVESELALTDLLDAVRDDPGEPSAEFLRRIASFADDPRATQFLLDLSRRGSPGFSVIGALGHLGTDSCIERLIELLPHYTYQVSLALNGVPADRRVSGMLRAYRKPGPFRRYGADHVLKYAAADGIAAVVEALDDRLREVRSQAVQALARLGPAVVPTLTALAMDGSSTRRTVAIEGLALTGGRQEEQVLRALLLDPVGQVRKAAQRAMKSFDGLTSEAQAARASVAIRPKPGAVQSSDDNPAAASGLTAGDEFATLKLSTTGLAPLDAADDFAVFAPQIRSPIRDVETMARASASPAAPTLDDACYFSMMAPLMAQQSSWFIVELWCHEETPDVFVRQQSRQFGWQPPSSFGPVAVEHGATIDIELRLPGFEIQEPRGVLRWQGKVGVIGFALRSAEATGQGTHLGSAHVSIGGVPIARLYFQIETGPAERRPSDCTTGVLMIESAFASYSSNDRSEVLARIQGMQKILPHLDVFLDVISLRSGDRWEERLRDEIGRRDAFFLFWSRSARASRWVDYEWRTALKARGASFIDPVPLESPDVAPPPEELSDRHFDDWSIRFR